MRKDNLHLRAELNDARARLISRDNLIKELQQQLADPSFRKANVNELKVNLKKILGIKQIFKTQFYFRAH